MICIEYILCVLNAFYFTYKIPSGEFFSPQIGSNVHRAAMTMFSTLHLCKVTIDSALLFSDVPVVRPTRTEEPAIDVISIRNYTTHITSINAKI